MRILVIISVFASVLQWLASTVVQADDLDALNARTVSLYQEEKYQEAIPLAEQHLRSTKSKFGPENLAFAESLHTLALLSARSPRLNILR